MYYKISLFDSNNKEQISYIKIGRKKEQENIAGNLVEILDWVGSPVVKNPVYDFNNNILGILGYATEKQLQTVTKNHFNDVLLKTIFEQAQIQANQNNDAFELNFKITSERRAFLAACLTYLRVENN